ncbi:hypothetical protein TRAPUB_9173 [Trametes pubescens]|uniref:Peptidase A1 domain-containing protein n=1 Tax=Trametes pubescens TaxID=154538 RepID=A0A1M2W3H0_TRAPU|nr:hypothetical protein TRAPUB_9173 [Trametes pubescens]
MAPVVSTSMGNDFPEDVLLIIILHIPAVQLNGLLRTCKRYYGILAPHIYRSVYIDIPPSGYPNSPGSDRPFQILNCLTLSSRHAAQTGDTSRFHLQFIRSISYISYDPQSDLRALPMLTTLLRMTVLVRHIHIDINQESVPLAIDMLRRRGLLRIPPTSMLDVVKMPPESPVLLPCLESVRSTKIEIVAALLEHYPLKTAAVDHAVSLQELAPLLPQANVLSRSHLTKLSVGVYAHESEISSVIRAIAAAFPRLDHLAIRCPGKACSTYLEAILGALKSEEAVNALGDLRAISINHSGRRNIYGKMLQAVLDDVRDVGTGRPPLRQVVFGKAMVSRTDEKATWKVTLKTPGRQIRISAYQTSQCTQSNAGPPHDDSKTFQPSGGDVDLIFGDSVTGTHASGPTGRDTVTLAGLVEKQPLAAVNYTDNSALANSSIEMFVEQTASSGPVVSRLILSDAFDEPLFSMTLQRDTIEVSGQGQIAIGQPPEDVNNSSLTWVPVRLYDTSVGGLSPPSFAPNEVYPLHWEVELDGVYLDDKLLPVSMQQAVGIPDPSLSALIDTGNAILRGPNDVVNTILSTVSPAFAADASAQPAFPCTDAHALAFQIGDARFPVDAHDIVSQASGSSASGQAACAAGNIVAMDAPRSGSLFSWNFGDPFLKSNLVVFYYGNLTHPSVDPPRMGFKSLVPTDAADLLEDAVGDAQKAGGSFESTADTVPTASNLIREDATESAAKATCTAHGPLSAAQPNSAQISFNYAVGSSIWNMLFPVIFGSVLREL